MFYEGQKVRLLKDMEELKSGSEGVVRLAEINGNETDGVEFETDCISVHRRVDGHIERVIDHVELVDPGDTQPIDVDAILARRNMAQVIDSLAPHIEPELPVEYQAVVGFLSLLCWDIETRRMNFLSDDQLRVLQLVRQIVAPELAATQTQSAAD